MGKFAPGTSGNPKGRPPTQKAVRELLEPFTEQAVLTLVELMQDPAEKPTAVSYTHLTLPTSDLV